MNQPVQTQMEHSLDLLEVEPTHGWDDIEEHYRRLVQRWHPDRNAGEGSDAAKNKFIEINSAYKQIRAYYRNTGNVPRHRPPEQQSPLLGSKKPIQAKPALYKNRAVITGGVGILTVALFATVLWSLDTRLAENNRDRALDTKLESNMKSAQLPAPSTLTEKAATTEQSSLDAEF